jgi:co-chaperonin GroES (HSP10)
MSAPITPVLDLRPDRTKTYQPFKTILDRILVKRVAAASTADGFEISEKYREKSLWGEVVAVGDFVVLGRECHKITDFVDVGDRVRYGEMTAEPFDQGAGTDQLMWLVRLQDIRGVERLIRSKYTGPTTEDECRG